MGNIPNRIKIYSTTWRISLHKKIRNNMTWGMKYSFWSPSSYLIWWIWLLSIRVNLVHNVLLNLVQGNHFRILCNTVANLKKSALTLADPKVGQSPPATWSTENGESQRRKGMRSSDQLPVSYNSCCLVKQKRSGKE